MKLQICIPDYSRPAGAMLKYPVELPDKFDTFDAILLMPNGAFVDLNTGMRCFGCNEKFRNNFHVDRKDKSSIKQHMMVMGMGAQAKCDCSHWQSSNTLGGVIRWGGELQRIGPISVEDKAKALLHTLDPEVRDALVKMVSQP